MKEVHALVDLENNQPTLEDVRRLVPGMTDVWLFHSGQQAKHLESYASLGERRTVVPITRKGPNSLDFHLAFYLGYIASRRSDAKLVVVAIDGGYVPMILHAEELGFDVGKVAFTKKVAPSPKAVPAKKATAKQTAVSARKAPAAKKVAAKKMPVAGKTAPPRKAAEMPQSKATADAVEKPSPSSKVITATKQTGQKILKTTIDSLRKMGDKRPKKLKSFQRHVGSMLGAKATERDIHALVANLLSAGAVTVTGDTVTYRRPIASDGR